MALHHRPDERAENYQLQQCEPIATDVDQKRSMHGHQMQHQTRASGQRARGQLLVELPLLAQMMLLPRSRLFVATDPMGHCDNRNVAPRRPLQEGAVTETKLPACRL